jgi:hypothetical protein
MKRILFIFFMCLIPLTGFGQSIFRRGIKVGNDVPVGNDITVVDSITKSGNNFKLYNGATRLTESDVVHDTVDALKAAAIDIDEYLGDYTGAASGADSISRLQFIIGTTTGAPANGDSTITHSAFEGLDVNVFRDGSRQYLYTTPTDDFDHFRWNSTTGTATVHPPWSTGELVIMEAFEPITLTTLSIEGQESALIDSLIAYWSLDEPSGVVANDAVGLNDGTTDATVNQLGKIGKSYLFDGSEHITVPYNATLLPTDDELSFGCWFYLSTLPSVEGHNYNLLRERDSDVPYYAVSAFIHTTDYIAFYVTNSAGTVYEFETAVSAVSAGQWYYVACVNEGTGVDAKIYLGTTPANIADVTSSHPTAFSGDLLQFNGDIVIGNHSAGETLGIKGYMDEVAIFDEALTLDQIKELAATTYPF